MSSPTHDSSIAAIIKHEGGYADQGDLHELIKSRFRRVADPDAAAQGERKLYNKLVAIIRGADPYDYIPFKEA